MIDATVWVIMQTKRVGWETMRSTLIRIMKENAGPLPENLEAYDRHWNLVASKLAREFGF